MSICKDVIHFCDKDGNENIPIAPIEHIDLEKHASRYNYSKLMLKDFDNISFKTIDDRSYEISNYYDTKPYYLQIIDSPGYNSLLYEFFSKIENMQWYALYKVDEMIAAIIIAGRLLYGKKYPYRFHKKPFITPKKHSHNNEVVWIPDEDSLEGRFHSELFKRSFDKKQGLSEITLQWNQRYYHLDYSGIANCNTDYSKVYHFNDSVFFVGSRGQALQLALLMADRGMDRICKNPIISYDFYQSMKSLNSGIVPEGAIKDICKLIVNIAAVDIPIIDKIDDDKFVFYKHNFDKYQDQIKKQFFVNKRRQ